MRKTENRRNKVQMPAGIRQKMMAAVSMLMVSCIMLVSSTYAWFTLSTAPEVTGITTNVGANGNLEMLLLTGYTDETTNEQAGSYYSDDDDLGVISEVGDSMAVVDKVTTANVKWGNLVDLSDESYGLDNIVLSPARMTLTKVGESYQVNTSSILNVPSYGTDGRVIDVETSVYSGKWNTEKNSFDFDEVHKGVRALGTTTDVSQQLAAYRTAKNDMKTAITLARSSATTSLSENGQNLANMLVAYMNDENTTYTNDDLAVLEEVLDSLVEANEHIADAMKNAVLAYSLSQAVDSKENGILDDAAVTALKKAIITDISSEFGETNSITGIASFTGDHVVIPTGLDTAITAYKNLGNKINSAISSLNDLRNDSPKNGSYSYSDISTVLNDIIKKEKVKIAGELDPGKDDLQAIVDEVMSKGSVTITMMSGSGVYADIAEMVEDYSVSNLPISVTYSGNTVNAKANMVTEAKDPVNNTKIGPYVTSLSTGKAPGSSAETTTGATISDTYGYALDFGFRTNAAVSDLQLQTSAANRVYSDQTPEKGQTSVLNTQGSGSYMQFASTDITTFTKQDVLNLMSAIRIAFIDAESGEMLALGALDITRKTDSNTAITTYLEGDTTEEITGGYKTGLFLYKYTVDEETKAVVLGDKLDDKSAITALTQNVASKITVLVYLDGDIVDNTMVGNATQSMTGKMNLQFSSSATLAPMENTTMRSGGLGTPGAVDVEIDIKSEVGPGKNYEYKGYKGTVRDGYYIYADTAGTSYYYTTDNKATNVIYTKLTTANVSDVIEITVSDSGNSSGGTTTVAVTGIALDKTTATLTLIDGQTVTETLTATVTLDNATDKTVTWKSSDETVATVSNGIVTALKAGTTTITATAGEQSATCEITVQ